MERDREDTEELLLRKVREKVSEATPKYTRRNAYLGIWGVVYAAVGLIFGLSTNAEISTQAIVFGVGFTMSGGVSIAAAIIRTHRLDVLAFSSLSGVAAARGLWTFFDPRGLSPILFTLSILLWLGVASAQVVVAGWPVTPSSRGRPSRPSGGGRG